MSVASGGLNQDTTAVSTATSINHRAIASTAPQKLSLMNPKQVGELLSSMGVGDDVVTTFGTFVITGKMVVDGLSEDDLKEMGFTSALKRRGIMQILGQLVSSANDGL